jgi:hypothetical protein
LHFKNTHAKWGEGRERSERHDVNSFVSNYRKLETRAGGMAQGVDRAGEKSS